MTMPNACAVLQAMNIPLWAKRPRSAARLFFLNPKMHARLLLVLEKRIPEKVSEIQTVFLGMLKVLNLHSQEMVQCWRLTNLTNANTTENLDTSDTSDTSKAKEMFDHALQYWQPQNILFLGHSFFEIELHNANYFVTHHPEELVRVPQYKREAYQVLLSLKESLNRGVPSA